MSDSEYVWRRGRIFRGTKEDPVDLNEAADEVREIYRPGYTGRVLFDKWQAVATIQQLQREWGDGVVEGYDFTNTSRKRLFKNVFTVIRDRAFRIYSDILGDCWKQSCSTCNQSLSCDEQVQHELLRELQGLQCDSDFNVTHGNRGDDVTVATGLALLAAAQDDSSVTSPRIRTF